MRGTRWMAGAALVASAATLAPAEVLITEIMYDPASSEAAPVKTEWVEIYNTGDQAVDLTGWYLEDEDARTDALPTDVLIGPGEAIVLIPQACSVEEFQAAWGQEVRAYPLGSWTGRSGTLSLANNPSETNEILTLRNDGGDVVDEVNYQNKSPWPSGKSAGSSIYLLPEILKAEFNDEGARWRFAEAGTHGARAAMQTDVFDPRDTGSPGTVVTADE